MNINPTTRVASAGAADIKVTPPQGSKSAVAPEVSAQQAAQVQAANDARQAVKPEELKSSVDAINRFLKTNSEVQFSIDDSSGRSVVKVIDTETKKLLRQFPSEQVLEIGKDISKGVKGLLVKGVA